MEIRLQNVVLPARRFMETVSFYKEVLRLEVVSEAPGFCFLRAGGSNVAIHPVDEGNEFSPTGRGIYLDLLVDSLEKARSSLASGGTEILKEWTDDNGDFLLVADPEGNLLEIYEAK